MSKQAFMVTLAATLAWLGVIAILAGVIRDEKSFYFLSAACMSLASALLLLFTRSRIRFGR